MISSIWLPQAFDAISYYRSLLSKKSKCSLKNKQKKKCTNLRYILLNDNSSQSAIFPVQFKIVLLFYCCCYIQLHKHNKYSTVNIKLFSIAWYSELRSVYSLQLSDIFFFLLFWSFKHILFCWRSNTFYLLLIYFLISCWFCYIFTLVKQCWQFHLIMGFSWLEEEEYKIFPKVSKSTSSI